MSAIFRQMFAGIGRLISALFNIPIKLKYVIIVLLAAVGAGIGITSSRMIENVGGKEDYEEARRYIEIKDVVQDNFIDPVDRGTMGDYATAAMISGLGDKWSYYMTADEYKTYQLSSVNEYSGIGMSIIKDEDHGGFQIMAVNAESPANLAGLGAGMIITSVDGEDVSRMDSDEVRLLIRSRLNGKFTIGIAGQKDEFTVDCTKTYVSAVAGRMEKTEAGYVKIDNFEAGSGDDAVAAIEDLLAQGAIALVIDLRGNPGGLMEEVRILLDYLLPAGELFVSTDKNGKEEVTKSDSLCIQLPMCVLVNSETYSAAEICAAVLQEYQWATIMGESTLGQTRTQHTIELADGGAIRLSTNAYLTPNRVDLAVKGGVVPDSIVYNTDASATGTTDGTTGESDGTASVSNDEQLMAALRLLSKSEALA